MAYSTVATDSIQISPCSLTRKITSHSMKNLAFHSLLRWKIIIDTTNSHHLNYTFLLKFGRMYFSKYYRSERINAWVQEGMLKVVGGGALLCRTPALPHHLSVGHLQTPERRPERAGTKQTYWALSDPLKIMMLVNSQGQSPDLDKITWIMQSWKKKLIELFLIHWKLWCW